MTIEVDEIVCGGGSEDFLTLRYLSLYGDNFSIGQDLTRIWRDRHSGQVRQFDPLLLRAQREWMEKNCPQNLERI